MAQIKTTNLLPEVFRTDTNQKFLNATLDQLVTKPDLRNINGYVGRTFAPTFKSTDNYQSEPTAMRQNYQLEPSVVVKNKVTGETEFFSSYIDLLNQINHYGGFTNNQTRLFSGQSYSYGGLFDFDKFINFNQYYWLKDGPQAVEVFANEIPTKETFTVTRDPATGSYKFSTASGVENPLIQLAYGGTYTFIVNQPGYPFWIQTDPGTGGTKSNQTKLSSRDVMGVTNNGVDVGTITFKVPQPTAQDFFVRMGLAGTADLSTTLSYNQVQGQRLSAIVAAGDNGFDGVSAINQITLKSLIFVNNDLDDASWTVNSQTVPVANRRNAWQISLSNDADPIVTLNPLLQAFTVGALQKVFVRGGVNRAEFTYYLAPDYLQLNLFNVMPDITAPLTTLYYQDNVASSMVGQIGLMAATDSFIDVTNSIIGSKSYKSPNGVVFTNGLKVTFDSSATPATYQGNTYYVDGVGSSIKLIDVNTLITPEPFAANGLTAQDYITINRSSIDLNPWSRSNRWFHIDIINASAAYNGTTAVLDQSLRASRPIIEFEANMQLFNFGRSAIAPVDLINFSTRDSRNAVELQPYGTQVDGVTLQQGMRVVFANDFDPTVRGKVYVVNIVYIQSLLGNAINLVPAEDETVSINNNFIIMNGPYKGQQYYYTGTQWVLGQQKTGVNQPPLFDVIDRTGASISTYTNSTFAGTQIFSYAVGSGKTDNVLGFPLSYRNFNQIGDIQFNNDFDTDTFSYVDGTGAAFADTRINSVGWLQQNTDLTNYTVRNSWNTNLEEEKQFQVISGVYDGKNSYFKIDITQSVEATIPYFRVYKNAIQISGWEITTVGVLKYVHVTDSTLTTGDKIDILIYNSDAISKLGYYEVPKNLDFNSENKNFSTLTLGQLRNHVSTMVANSNQMIGNFPGDSNLRDLNIKAQGGSILQHASPVLYSALFLVDEQANFMKGLDLARREYSKVKNKIVEYAMRTPGLDFTNIPGLLDTILKSINSVKNKNFAWYYSDMVPYGDLKNTIEYTVASAEIVDYEISSIFSDTTLSNLSVLVYLNGVQLVKGKEYVFDTNRAGVTISAPLVIGDKITIYEYSDTDGNYIPETPTKLGLYPKFTPQIYFDTTYVTPINVIQGHDGSITPAFGDFRDDLLLEFEKRIYNNIKIDYTAANLVDIHNFIPGKFRTTEYSSSEFTQLLSDSFLSWVGDNRIDYITNTSFISSDSFTWNYSKFVDTINGGKLPGYWRAIYKYFYDTDRPHTHPWEMVGLSEQPSWWEARYGTAPYTGGNMVLWDDMAAGIIWNDGNPVTDKRFVRPGLQQVIPVDYTGSLLDPSDVLVKNFNGRDASGDFKIGDQGPVETAWRRSSDFPFAFQRALSLAKPAYYFGSLMDIGGYSLNTQLNQWIFDETLQRISPTDIDINGVIDENDPEAGIARGAGYLNWIAEYLRNQGIDPSTKLNGYLQNVSIQLAYKMAGFTDQSFIQVIAEQSSPTSTNNGVVIPNESYSIELYKSTPVATATYSAVVIERTGAGYTVSGYDTTAPYFTIIPSLANNKSYAIPVLKDTAVIYQDYHKYKVTIPYGYEFTTKQQVVDFLVSYQRYLRGVGFKFNEVDPDLGVQRDWILSVKEFLTWSQQGWNDGNVIVLSPTLNKISFFSATGVVDKIQNHVDESCIVDTSHNFVKYSQMSVNRQNIATGNTFTATVTNGQTLGLVKLSIVDYEHIMIFDNEDIFNDVIYVPELGNRQYRLKIVGKKTGSWTGAMNPPGFMYNSKTVDAWQPGTDYLMGTLVSYKNNNYTALQDIPAALLFDYTKWVQVSNNEIKTGLLPNFSYNAEKFNRFNDVDNPELLGDFHLYSDSAIGFQPRQYLTNFGLDEVTQAKFYQGYIRQKGTMNAINAFNAVGVNGAKSNINVYEEWAMRVGEYGALDNNRSVDLILTEGTFNNDPVTFTLLPNNGSSITGIIGVQPQQLYKTEGAYTPTIFVNRDDSSNYRNDIQTAGYVNINDATTTVFDLSANIADLTANINTLGIGDTVWTAKDLSSNWNIFRINETNVNVTKVTFSVDNIGVVTTDAPHGVAYGNVICIKGFDDRVNAFYRVFNVVDAYNFSVVFYGQMATALKQANTIKGLGPLFLLQSVRIKAQTDLNSITPAHGWNDNDKIWVDNDPTVNGWAVYNKTSPWTGNVSIFNPNMKLDANSYASSVGFGTVSTINATGTFAAASSQYLNTGNVYAFVSNVTNGNVLTLVANIGQRSGGTKFGASLETAGNLLYIGNPGDGATQQGLVHIHMFNGNASFPWTQTLSSPSASNVGDLYGASIDASADGTWLYVAAPNAGNVYVYQANATSYYTYANTITVGSSAAAQFGYSIKTTNTGNQVAISAPYQAVNGVSAAGAVYVYDRSIETFIANGTFTYTTSNPVSSNSRITVNGNVVTTGYTLGTNTVTFTNAPVVGSLINVETNKFQLLETITSPAPVSGGAFGLTTTISGNDADIYVASPGYSAPGYYSGIVYRYVNQGAAYGTITGTNYNPVITAGDSIRINGIAVTFTAGNVITAAQSINSANIPGVTAVAQGYGALTITSNVTVPYQKLIIGPGVGNAMANLGLNVFNSVQTLMHPGTEDVSQFGSQIAASSDSRSLVISASGGSTENATTFDLTLTTFDQSNSIFVDTIDGSGVVYVYGLVNGSVSANAKDQYVLVQRLQNKSLSARDQFGYSVAMNGNTMIVGAPGDSNSVRQDPISGIYTPITNAGTFYTYNNFSGNVGWDIVAQQTAKVDIDSISRMYLYNVNTQVISTHLDYIDPAKGKVLGAAQEDLDFITAYDPAVYNSVGGIDGVPNLAYNLDYHWGPEQVTKTWWNTGSVRYIDYEQGNLTYRANNWGKMFPGSTIQVCEWVASDMPPSAYAGPGTPLYADNSAYVVETTINPNTKLSKSTYYYWVTGKNSLEPNSVHLNTISTIQDIIENPQAQDIPYAAVVRNDSVSLHGIGKHLSGNSTILHMDYDTIRNTHVIHSEYQLVKEGDASSTIPARIVDKIIDSLSGVDANGFAVPDASLSAQEAVGLGNAPNQTVFKDRLNALKNWVEYVNGILIQYPIVEENNINPLYASAALPDQTTYDISVSNYVQLTYVDTTHLPTGYTVLVSVDETQQGLWTTYTWSGSAWVLASIQEFYTPFYWSKVDWFDSTYDNTVLPTYVVAAPSDVATLTLVPGNTVKVLNNGSGNFTIYRANADLTTSIVGIQNGTIQLNSNLYTTTVAANEIRIIFNAIKDFIFINTLAIYYNQMFFFLINYILTEQPSVDWVFKTSFISILHKFKTLGQPASYSPDNQTYYENYINEVKPYRTSIREYKLDYQGNDEYFGDSTDFDVPSSFIAAYGAYRSPNGKDARDSIWLSTLPQYNQWYNNHTYGIGHVYVANPGTGYVITPTVTVVGGGGSGAVVNAIVNFTNGSIAGFEVVNPGKGYTSTPTIFINGTGTGAVGYAKLVNHYQVDSVPTTQLDTTSNVTVYVGNIITQQNTGAYGTVYSASSGNVVTLVNTVGTFNTSDYIFSDASNLHTKISSTASYTQFLNTSYNTIRNLSTTLVFDRTSYTSNVVTWAPNITVANNSIIAYNGQAYQATANVYSTAILTLSNAIPVSVGQYLTQDGTTANAKVISVSGNATIVTVGNLTANFVRRGGNIRVNGANTLTNPVSISNVFDYTKYTLLKANSFVTATDRISSYYQPTADMPAKDFAQLMSGVEYPGVQVTGVDYEATTSIFNSNLIYTWANTRTIYSSNVTIPTLTVNLSSPAVVYTGNVITQATSGASGTVYQTSTGNVMTLVNVVGTFDVIDGYYLSANTANLNVTPTQTRAFNQVTTQNLVDFTKNNYASGQTMFLVDNDTNNQYELNITEVDTWRIIVSGNLPTKTLGSNISIKYYDFNNPTYLDTIVQNTYKGTTVDSTLDGGAYYDTYSSHAPEEMVPGATYDNLNMIVTTGLYNNTAAVSYRVVHNMNTSTNSELSLALAHAITANVGDTLTQYSGTNTITSTITANVVNSVYVKTLYNGNPTQLFSTTAGNVYLNNVNTGYTIKNVTKPNWPKYYGVSKKSTTVLTANLSIGDANIYVANAAAISPPNITKLTPGQIFINGEKIMFWGIDLANNVLYQVRRATDGTGAPAVHAAGSAVVDAGTNMIIPGDSSAHATTWLNPSPGAPKNIFDNLGDQLVDNTGNLFTTTGANASVVTDGLGLEGSMTAQAAFIQGLK